jgi:hypothetical protein
MEHHTMTRLADGRVLMAGKSKRASVFDPVSDTFEPTEPMVMPRLHHAATLLPDGRVLIAGGLDAAHQEPTGSIEVFDPDTLEFTEVGSLLTGRVDPTASTLADGRVMVTGGWVGSSSGQSSTEFITPTGT